MTEITPEYLDQLAPIYKDILQAFTIIDPGRKAQTGLAFQTLYTALSDKYTLGEIREACEQMEAGDAMEIQNEIFAVPTDLGESLIERLTGETAHKSSVPQFSPPPSTDA